MYFNGGYIHSEGGMQKDIDIDFIDDYIVVYRHRIVSVRFTFIEDEEIIDQFDL